MTKQAPRHLPVLRTGKDAARPEGKRRCCAIGMCCGETLSARSRRDARDTLRAALTCAVDDETIARNPVKPVKMTKRREPRQRRKSQAWAVDEARWFLESAWHAREALYAAFVLVLGLGLRRGEVLGLAWDQIDLDDAELHVAEQLQRVRGQLVRREVKTETSEAPLPLPDLCVTALKIRKEQQDADRERAGDGRFLRSERLSWAGDTGTESVTRGGRCLREDQLVPRCLTRAPVRGAPVRRRPGPPAASTRGLPAPPRWPPR